MKPSLAAHNYFSRVKGGQLKKQATIWLSIISLLAARTEALTIDVTYSGSILQDTNLGEIEEDINSVVTTFYQADFSNNVTLTVNVQEGGTLGAATNMPNWASIMTYSQTIFALQSDANTLDNVAVLSKVSPLGNNPLTNANTGFSMELALASALGLAGKSVNTGTIILGLQPNVTLNDNIVKQLFTHEMDEEMGTISGVGRVAPNVIDLSRYSAPGVRSFTTSTAGPAYFSPDGTWMGPQYFQSFASGQGNPVPLDFGDFDSMTLVQGYVTGAYIPTVERRMLNVAGWTYIGPTVANQTSSSPNSLVTPPISTVSTAAGVIPNASGNDVQITGGGGSGTVTLASATTIVNTLTNTSTATAVTVSLAGKQLVAGDGAVDAGTGLIEVGAGAKSMTIGASANDGTVTAGSSGAFTLGLINAAYNGAFLDIKSAIVDNAGGGSLSIIVLNASTDILEGSNTYSGTTTVGKAATLQIGNNGPTGSLGLGAVEVDGALVFYRSNAATVANSFTGAGSVEVSGAGTVTFSGSSPGFTGVVNVDPGSTLQVGAGGQAGDLGNGIVLVDGSLVFNRSDNFVVNNAIDGYGTLVQAGTGTLSIPNVNDFETSVLVKSGILQLANSGMLGTVTVSGGTLDIHGQSPTITGLAFGASASTLNVIDSGSPSGNLIVSGGVSCVGNGSSSSPSAIISANIQLPPGVHEFSSSPSFVQPSVVVSGVISGPGSISVGSVALVLTNKNSYAGSTEIDGSLIVSAANALPSTTAVILNGVLDINPVYGVPGAIPGTYNQTIGSLAGDGEVMMGNGALTVGADGTSTTFSGFFNTYGYGYLIKIGNGVLTLINSSVFEGLITVDAGAVQFAGYSSALATAVTGLSSGTLALAPGSNSSISVPVTGSVGVAQNGLGTVMLTSTGNTYSGAISVNSGVLLVSGSMSGSTATVNSGGTLAGTGTVGAVTVLSGGTLATGNGVQYGLLNTGNLSLGSGSPEGHLSLELGGISGTGSSSVLYSEIQVAGTVSLGGDVEISLFGGFMPVIGDVFFIILNDGVDPVTGTFSNAPGNVLSSGGYQYLVNYAAEGDGGVSANDVSLTVIAVPEINTGSALLFGSSILLGFGRLKRRRAA